MNVLVYSENGPSCSSIEDIQNSQWKHHTPWTQYVNWKYVQDVLQMSYIRTTYALCQEEGTFPFSHACKPVKTLLSSTSMLFKVVSVWK